MSFWPDDINDDEVLSPREILKDAADELESRNSKLSVNIVETRLQDRIVLAFEVTRRDVSSTLNLFEASQRLEAPYPVLIDPPETDIPEFLRREQYVPGRKGWPEIAMGRDLQNMIYGTPGKYVKNKWVCATPAEFKERLKELFSLDFVKARIIGLLGRELVANEHEDA